MLIFFALFGLGAKVQGTGQKNKAQTFLVNPQKCGGSFFYLQLELSCLQLSFFACGPLRPLLDALSHCKQKNLQL